jgi:sucrose-phosphate synthase
MAAGLPAAVTRRGGPSESLYEGATGREYGVLMEPTDAGDIAAGLLRLVGKDNQWETFQQAGRERVLARYTWERTAAGYLAVIEGMLAQRLAIPAYFWDPQQEPEPTIESLGSIWQAEA